MLTILYGTSCSGKTEIIKNLVEKHNYKIIMCYHTRKPRENDLARESITKNEFDELVEKGIIGFVNEHLDAKYGNKIGDFKNAELSKDNYILDWPLSSREKLQQFNHLKIIIIPQTIEQLKFQIIKSGREKRMDEILSDFELNYSEEKLVELQRKDYIVIVNERDQINQTINNILKHS